MNSLFSRTLGISLFLALAMIAAVGQTGTADLYAGRWKGEMTVGRAVPIEFLFERAGSSSLNGSAVEPNGAKTALQLVSASESGIVFRLERGEGSAMVFTGKLSADRSSMSGEVAVMEGKVMRAKAPWKAQKAAGETAPPAQPPATAVTRPAAAQTAYDSGKALHAKRDYTGAIAAFTECLKLAPKDNGCRYLRSTSYQAASKYTEAEADLTAVIQSVPKPPAAVYLARAEARIGAENYDGAVADSDAAFAANGTPDAYLTRGTALQQAGTDQFMSAIMYGTEAQAKTPALAAAAKGLAEFNKFIQAKPQDHRGYLKRGNYYYQMWNVFKDNSKLAASLADLNTALGISPANADILYARYLTNDALGNKTAAAADQAKYQELSKKPN